MVWCVRKAVFEDSAWEGFDFGEADWSPAEGMPCDAGGFHARADGEVADIHLVGDFGQTFRLKRYSQR